MDMELSRVRAKGSEPLLDLTAASFRIPEILVLYSELCEWSLFWVLVCMDLGKFSMEGVS